MNKNEKCPHVKFNAPLNEYDTETTTFGCRANNPDICKYYYMDDVCAFTNVDMICYKPSRAWKRQFNVLKQGENDGSISK